MSTVLTLTSLIDLAIGDEKRSEANFQVLQTALQAIVQQLNIKDTKVEFRGDDSEKIQKVIENLKDDQLKQNLSMTIIPEQSENEMEKKEPSNLKESSVLEGTESAPKKRVESTDDIVIVESGRVQEPTAKKLVTAAYLARIDAKVKTLQSQIESLQNQVMPSDEILLEAARMKREAKPISDLWQNLNITKRMSGAEEGIDRLASLLETVAKEYADLKIIIDRLETELGQDIVETMKQIKLAASYAKQIRPRDEIYHDQIPVISEKKVLSSHKMQTSAPGSAKDLATKIQKTSATKMQLNQQVTHDSASQEEEEESLKILSKSSSKVQSEELKVISMTSKGNSEQPELDEVPSKLSEATRSSIEPEKVLEVIKPIAKGDTVERNKFNLLLAQHEYMRHNLEYVTAKINTLSDFIENGGADAQPESTADGGGAKTDASKRDSNDSIVCYDDDSSSEKEFANKLNHLEERLNKQVSKLNRQDAMFSSKTKEYDKQLKSVSESVTSLVKTVKPALKDKNAECKEIKQRLKEVENTLTDTNKFITDLHLDYNNMSTILNVHNADLDILKISKSDKVELDEMLAEKADCRSLLEKVPFDVFDLTCNELARRMDETSRKLAAQDMDFGAKIDDLQQHLATKFDSDRVDSLKEEMRAQMEEYMKNISEISKAENEGVIAAAGKKRFMDVTCISCNRNASMKTQNNNPCIPSLANMPGSQNLRPYITYGMDHLRKMLNKYDELKISIQIEFRDPNWRGDVQFEELAKKYNIKCPTTNAVAVPTIENRYCGGSHTKLGPKNKVPHVGHFPNKEHSDNEY